MHAVATFSATTQPSRLTITLKTNQHKKTIKYVFIHFKLSPLPCVDSGHMPRCSDRVPAGLSRSSITATRSIRISRGRQLEAQLERELWGCQGYQAGPQSGLEQFRARQRGRPDRGIQGSRGYQLQGRRLRRGTVTSPQLAWHLRGEMGGGVGGGGVWQPNPSGSAHCLRIRQLQR